MKYSPEHPKCFLFTKYIVLIFSFNGNNKFQYVVVLEKNISFFMETLRNARDVPTGPYFWESWEVQFIL